MNVVICFEFERLKRQLEPAQRRRDIAMTRTTWEEFMTLNNRIVDHLRGCNVCKASER